MTTSLPNRRDGAPHDPVIYWLLDGDPAIRWQVLRDLLGAPDEQVAAERARVATEGAGAQLLALQQPNGTWAGAAWNRGWDSTMHVLSPYSWYNLVIIGHRHQLPVDQRQRRCDNCGVVGVFRVFETVAPERDFCGMHHVHCVGKGERTRPDCAPDVILMKMSQHNNCNIRRGDPGFGERVRQVPHLSAQFRAVALKVSPQSTEASGRAP